MTGHLTILIAACGRGELLAKTLASLSQAQALDQVDQVVVVENDTEPRLEAVVQASQSSLPTSYLFSEQRNKSLALNRGLQVCRDGLIVFLDDDVRVDPQLIHAYQEGSGQFGPPVFFGGPFGVDYRRQPDDSFLPYMTASTKGWSLGGSDQWVNRRTCFLGFNWAAYRGDLMAIGGFDARFGPGARSGATGQESQAQRKLRSRHGRGRYLSQAMVWHHVSEEQVQPEWILRRRERAGRDLGQIINTSLPRLLRTPAAHAAIALQRLRFRRAHVWNEQLQQFDQQWWNAYTTGTLATVRHRQD